MKHEYSKTGRFETDACIDLANKAHNYYFEDPLKYKIEFAKTAKQFFNAINEKFITRTKEENIKDALQKFFGTNHAKSQYFTTELFGINKRLDIIIKNPNLVDRNTLFVLDHTARFIEIILPYACSVKEEVEMNRKFSFEGIVDKEFNFFKNDLSEYEENVYLQAFYDNGWRAQKNLNGFAFIKKHLNIENTAVSTFYKKYGGYDTFSSLIFARMANEQYLKYLSSIHNEFWDSLREFLPAPIVDKVIANKDNNDIAIKIPNRIDALCKAKVLNELIANEVKLVNVRGNNIAHHGIPGVYSSCYHNLEVLNYLNQRCK